MDIKVADYVQNLQDKLTQMESKVAEYAMKEKALVHENQVLRQRLKSYEDDQVIEIVKAKIVDNRTVYNPKHNVVEYQLEIDTVYHGKLYVWHRYSTFCKLADDLKKKKGYNAREIPELKRMGFFTKQSIDERTVGLNNFLHAIVNAPTLQWGVRLENKMCAYKRRRQEHETSIYMRNTSNATMSAEEDFALSE